MGEIAVYFCQLWGPLPASASLGFPVGSLPQGSSAGPWGRQLSLIRSEMAQLIVQEAR